MAFFQIIRLMLFTIFILCFNLNMDCLKNIFKKGAITKFTIGIVCCFFSLPGFAQTSNAIKVKEHKFALYGGGGPSFYFNNLVLAQNNVHPLNYSFTGRIMWEPGHLLSLGVETGYYRLYTVKNIQQEGFKISNAVIPFQLVVSMKFLKSFYVNFASGQSILINNVSLPGSEKLSSTSFSLGDFSGSLGYKRQLNSRISISAETMFFYSSQLNDKNIALLFMVGYVL